MTEYTIITTNGTLTVTGTRWTRSGDDVYVYDDDSDTDTSDPVAEVDGATFIGIFDRESGTYAQSTAN